MQKNNFISFASSPGVLNPFRYRGYIYDEETGYYYLRSRYYYPNRCRFINADSITNEVVSYIIGKKEVTVDNIIDSAATISVDCLVNGTVYYQTGKRADTVRPTEYHQVMEGET